MTIPECFTGLVNPETSAELTISGVNFNFEGFQARVLELNLEAEEFKAVKEFLGTDLHHQHQTAVIIYDGQKPRLSVVTGVHDYPYLFMTYIDPEDKQIFVHGNSGLHPLKDITRMGFLLSHCLPTNNNESGMVTITKQKGNLIIKAEPGRRLNSGWEI